MKPVSTPIGQRADALVPPLGQRLGDWLGRAEPWLGLLAVAVLFSYPSPLVPLALAGLGLGAAWRIISPSMTAPRPLAAERAAASSAVIDVAFLLFTLGATLGLVVAHHQDAALLRFTGLLGAVASFYLARRLLVDEVALRRCALFVLAGVAVGVIALLALLRGQLPSSALQAPLEPLLALFGGFAGISGDTLEVNARFAVHQYGLAYLLLVGGAFAASALAVGPSRRVRVAGGVALAILSWLLLVTQARGAVVALTVAAAAVGALRTRWAWLTLPVAGAAFFALLQRGTISRSIEADWLNQRLTYWTGTLGVLGDFPFSGAGLGVRTFAEVYAWYHGLPDPYVVSHTHNIYLQAYAEQGLLGLFGLLALVVAGSAIGLGAARRMRGPDRWVVAGAAAAVLGAAIYGLTDQVPSTNLGLGLLFVLLAMLVRAANLGGNPSPPGPVSHEGRGGAGRGRGDRAPTPLRASGRGRSRGLATVLVLLAVGAVVGLAPRWASGALLNAGSADVVAQALDRSTDGVARSARLLGTEDLLATAGRWNSANVAAQRNLGWVRLLRHDIPGAHAAIEAAYRPDLTPFERAQQARLARQAGLIDRAVTLLKEGRDEARLREVAEQMWAARRWHDAALAYAALTELDPDEAEYVSNAAIAVLNGGGDAEEAMSLLKEAVTKNPGAARNLARQLVLRGEPCRSDERRGGGRFECAAFWFGLASRVDPTYDRPEVELGSIFYYRGRYEDAARHFGEAARREPSNPSTHNQLGDTYLRLGRLDQAIASYERAVQLRPERPELHVHLARAYTQAGRREDALREYRVGVELAPTDQAVRDELGRLEASGQ